MFVSTRMPPPGVLGLGLAVDRMVSEDGLEDRDAAHRAIAEYEPFFLATAALGRVPSPPSPTVARVWNRHMLDTRAYVEQCLALAGGYVHRTATSADSRGLVDPRVDLIRPASSATADAAALEAEDFSRLLSETRTALASGPGPTDPWAEQAVRLIDEDPRLAAREYRRFLRLLILGEGPITPGRLVDEIWHRHILNSREYVAFCGRVAGGYIHHDPSYGRPLAIHAARFEDARAAYRRRLAAEPPARVWSTMGGSEGGGDGGGSSSPLYEINLPHHMLAHLRVGRVDRRFRGSLHPVLAHLGVSRETWRDAINLVQTCPRIRAEEFLERVRPRDFAMVAISSLFLTVWLVIAMGLPLLNRSGTPMTGASLLLLTSLVYPPALSVCLSIAWYSRPFDLPELHRRARALSDSLAPYGVSVRVAKGYGQFAARVRPGCTQPEFLALRSIDRPWLVVVEAVLYPLDVLRRREEMKRRRREARLEAARRRRAWLSGVLHRATTRGGAMLLEAWRGVRGLGSGLNAARGRAVAELRAVADACAAARWRRRVLREERYLDLGVKPGPLAWFRAWPDWLQAVAVGLAAALPLGLGVASLFLWGR